MVIQADWLDTSHRQPAVVVTVTVNGPPAEGTRGETGPTECEQPLPIDIPRFNLKHAFRKCRVAGGDQQAQLAIFHRTGHIRALPDDQQRSVR
jgi:hypothetical protein